MVHDSTEHPLDIQIWFQSGPNIHGLNISHNSLPELSSHIWKLNALVELKISHNWLEHLPENIQNAQNLRILDLSHNFLKYLPAKIIYLELQTLDVSMNPFAKKWECDILVPSLAQFAAKTLEQYCRERQVIFQFDVINEYVARNATHNCYYCENICTSPYVYATRALKPILEVAINVIKETPDMPVVLFEFCFCFPCKDKDY
ncbi:PREDICTED: uncharacterized protein LOC108775167 [Cyphomyrmex costatus]|uniref:uncharacterized protein LOC108775167 n=1 Tax=Cyphomyrmex costatus TaxID=456900 RepID=UPI0008524580|nr:PREDICTED: uncharacterized protein LOC108775167 [Cyphomyrmex costatus]